MHNQFNKVIDCSQMTLEECSDALLIKFGHGADLKLRADHPEDTVNGSVTIVHYAPPEPHEIIVEIYEADEPPAKTPILATDKEIQDKRSFKLPESDQHFKRLHDTTFKKPIKVPTKAELARRLEE